jgi:hypothetical protein
VADAGRLYFEQYFTRLGTIELHGHDLKRFSSLKGNGGAGFHLFIPF